jgi:tetratricopeptide (TPR) repeat protein
MRRLLFASIAALTFISANETVARDSLALKRGDCQPQLDRDKAIAACTRLIQSGKLSRTELEDAYVTRAHLFTDQALMSSNQTFLGQALVDRTDYLRATTGRGKAIDDFGKAIELDPDNAKLYKGRSFAYRDTSRYKEAIEDMNVVIRLKPDIGEFHQRGEFFLRDGQYAAAVADFNRVIAMDASAQNYLSLAVERRGTAYMGLGEYTRAIDDFSEVMRLANSSTDFMSGAGMRAYAYRAAQQYDKAISDYDELLRRNPKVTGYYLYRAMANIEAGRLADAQADLDRGGSSGFSALISYIVQARQGNDDDSRLKAEVTTPDLQGADLLIYELFLGRSTPDRVVAAAEAKMSLHAWPERSLLCRTKGFVGEWYLLKRKIAEAREQFKYVADNCGAISSALMIFPTAIAELARLRAEPDQSSTKVSSPSKASDATGPPEGPAADVKVLTPSKPLEAVVSLGQSAVANQDRRVALVIGNSKYKNVPALINPVHDAEMVAGVLKRTGFEDVTLLEDLNKDAMVDALRNFAAKTEKADWAVVYYAGHGMEVGGINYLIPVDARLATDRDTGFEAVPLDQVLNAAERASRLRLVILDACRDNPFKSQMKRTLVVAASRGVSVGLAPIEPDPGTLVVYAAKSGEKASDGDGDHGPFAIAFVKDVLTPGLEVRRLFDFVRDDVLEMTHREQQPFSYGSISGRQDFYFVAPTTKSDN